MKSKILIALSFGLCLSCVGLKAQEADLPALDQSAARAEIKAQKAKIGSDFKAKEADCYQKFAVTACIKQANSEKNAAMADVKRRELALNDEQRAHKQQQYEQKRVDSAAKSNEKKASATSAANAKTMKNAGANNTATPSPKLADQQKRLDAAKARAETAIQKKKSAQAKAVERDKKNAQAALESAKYQSKLDQANAHKQQVEQKNQNQSKPKAAGLPVPAVVGK